MNSDNVARKSWTILDSKKKEPENLFVSVGGGKHLNLENVALKVGQFWTLRKEKPHKLVY